MQRSPPEGGDAGAEVAQPAIDPSAIGHVGDGKVALLMGGDIGDAANLGLLAPILSALTAEGYSSPTPIGRALCRARKCEPNPKVDPRWMDNSLHGAVR